MFKLFSLMILLVFAMAANFANATPTTVNKLATPAGLTMSLFPPYAIQWNKVPGATSYRIVITQDVYYNGFTESNNAKGQCNVSCATVEIPATPDGQSKFDGGDILTSSDGTILYTPSPSIYAKSGTYPKIGLNYIKIKAYGDKFSKSDWRNLTIANGTGSDLFSTIKPSTIDSSFLEKEHIYSETDKCRDHSNWCITPNYDLFGFFAQESSESINLINNSYVIDGFKVDLGIKANIYNRGYADAVIDVYDANKNWSGFAIVSGHRPSTSLPEHMKDTAINTYENWTTELSSYDPRRVTSSKKTEVEVIIPPGGYAVMSKNSTTAITNTALNTVLDVFGAKNFIKIDGRKKASKKLFLLLSQEIAKSSVKVTINLLKKAMSNGNTLDAMDISKDIAYEAAFTVGKVLLTEGNRRNEIIRIMGEMGMEKEAYRRIFGKALGKKIAKTGIPGLGTSEIIATSIGLSGQWMNIAADNEDKNVIFK
jgi:hypothetical protein